MRVAVAIAPRTALCSQVWGVDAADLAKYAGHSVATANSRYVQALDRSAGLGWLAERPGLGALERLHGAGVVDVHERVELARALAANQWL